MTRNLICIICPRGCSLSANFDGEEPVVTGNGCPRGKQYAIDECTHPVRTVTSTVTVEGRTLPVSVKTETPIAKDRIFDAMEQIRAFRVKPPVHIGDVIAEDVFGSRIVATKEVK